METWKISDGKIMERTEMEMRKEKPFPGKTAGEHGNRKAEKMSNKSTGTGHASIERKFGDLRMWKK